MQRQWRISQRESSQNALMRRCRLTYLYVPVPSQVRLYLTFGTRARPLPGTQCQWRALRELITIQSVFN